MAQTSADILATFVRKFVRKAFWKLTQSGHTDFLVLMALNLVPAT